MNSKQPLVRARARCWLLSTDPIRRQSIQEDIFEFAAAGADVVDLDSARGTPVRDEVERGRIRNANELIVPAGASVMVEFGGSSWRRSVRSIPGIAWKCKTGWADAVNSLGDPQATTLPLFTTATLFASCSTSSIKCGQHDAHAVSRS